MEKEQRDTSRGGGSYTADKTEDNKGKISYNICILIAIGAFILGLILG